jgi:hypothetical protein
MDDQTVDLPEDDEEEAFPAGEQVPGQAESRSAYERFRTMLAVQTIVDGVEDDNPEAGRIDWWQEYLALRAEGWDWRKAAYIAWAASPTDRRWPGTQDELARRVLGLRSDRVISRWKAAQPELQARIEQMQVAPLMAHTRDVIEALIAVARRPDPSAHQDRRLFLEITKIYQPKGQVALTGEDGGPVDVVHVYIPDNGRDEVAEQEPGAAGQPD